MPATKNQDLRQEIIHGLLGVSKLHLTKQELLDKVNEKLEVRDFPAIHWRTLNNDLTYLKRCGAEIHIPNRGDPYYYYMDAYYPEGTQFDEEDIDILTRGIQILKRISGFRIARDIEAMLERLKYTRFMDGSKGKGYIAFEDHTLASGTEWLDPLAEAILFKTVLKVDYRSFRHPPDLFLFHPYFLKEYRNRWYVMGRHQVRNALYTLALDRIHEIRPAPDDIYLENDIFEPESYFQNLIGVTKEECNEPAKVVLQVTGDTVPYVESKKIHHSQHILNRNPDGSIEIELYIVINYELVSTILGFGAAVKVVGPTVLKNKIFEELTLSQNQY
ncbi:MAG: WYL domain-containing protein [Bacteroidales bacterium]|nr:WYL domain-containing protein [Bacteroidales bacterium]